MQLVAGIVFRHELGVQYLEAPDGNLEKGMVVVAQSPYGPKLARVVVPPQPLSEAGIDPPMHQILRAATSEDQARARGNRVFEEQTLMYALKRAAAQNLPMKLITAECSLDGRHLTIYFTAPHRVDFRALVKELAAKFHVRIRLTQVGERDEARLQGGVGPCGQMVCCMRFMTGFDPVSIQAAKLQDLPLNSTRLAGLCGKLKCCLNFEKEVYEEAEESMPGLGARVSCPCGEGLVIERNVPKATVLVSLDDTSEVHEVPVCECQWWQMQQRAEEPSK
jgi:cell fate regulator YaaT (PSP1 superfamily)